MTDLPWQIPAIPREMVPWTPLKDKENATKKYGKLLDLHTDAATWGVGQLMYLNLDWNSASKFIDFNRIHYDKTYGEDFATLASILNTNRIPCRSWSDFKHILDVYNSCWANRLLISFFCEGIGQTSNLGKPLYFSELVGYTKGNFFKRTINGFLDRIVKDPSEGFDWMILRIIEKSNDPKARSMLRKMLGNNQRYLVFPFLIRGSNAWASFNLLEESGGINVVVGAKIQEGLADYVYMMAICGLSNLLFFSKNTDLFSIEDLFRKIKIQELIHFGGDTSIRTSPHFLILAAEIGHYVFPSKHDLHVFHNFKEIPDYMLRQLAQSAKLSIPDNELIYSRMAHPAPYEMRQFVRLHRKFAKETRKKTHYTINPDYLKKIRQPGYFSKAPARKKAPSSNELGPMQDGIQDQYLKLINEFIQIKDLHSKRIFLSRHRELLDDRAAAMALVMSDYAAENNNAELFHLSSDSADLLGRCLKKGLDIGFEDHLANRRSLKESKRMMKARNIKS
ncbi:MAG: hypothetical protein ACFFDT_37195 [Candidatus Hodarchaeota archaeon]